MNQPTVMQHLVWKDVRLIRPLFLLVIATMVAVNALIFIARISGGLTETGAAAWCGAMSVMLPVLMAFGAPAMLVGGEEDGGTLAWLRTLPIGWRQIAWSKFWVAVVAVIGTWTLATCILWIQSVSLTPASRLNLHEMLEFDGQITSLYFILLLLVFGFVTSYWLRSPLAALLTLLPLYTFVALTIANVSDANGIDLTLLLTAIAGLLVGWILQRELARRRLCLPERKWSLLGRSSSGAVYRYRLDIDPTFQKPAIATSLLWQQVRQTVVPATAIVLLAGVLWAMPYAMVRGAGATPRMGVLMVLGGLSPMFFVLGAGWLGVLAFYGDSLQRRCAFLADRGIPANEIWWTRVLPPAIALTVMMTVVLAIASVVTGMIGAELAELTVVCCIMFAFGQLVSQWSDRPIFAFLVAPAYAFITFVPTMALVDFAGGVTGNWYFALIWVIPVLLFASWRLTPQWLAGRPNRRYAAHVVGYTVVAMLLPAISLLLVHAY